jgi:formylglycine-generating enzyme required for sulfatase activity
MVSIPAGSFLMGSPENEPDRIDDEGPQHKVTLSAFLMSQTPITQAQWRAVAALPTLELDLNPDPSNFKGPNRPVESVNWFEAMEFCRRLSRHTGRFYTLPSEAQWEYACRAGTTTPFYCGATLLPGLANFNGRETKPVASFPANAWGLHDMHGNVWEWCLDEWHDNYNEAPTDGSAWLREGNSLGELPGACCAAGRGATPPRTAVRPSAPTTSRSTATTTSVSASAASNKYRLLRGGSWHVPPAYCRSAFRGHFPPDDRGRHIGFRVCCLPQDEFFTLLPFNSSPRPLIISPFSSQTLAWLQQAAKSGDSFATSILHIYDRLNKYDENVAQFLDNYTQTIGKLCRRLDALEREVNLHKQDEDVKTTESDSIADAAPVNDDAPTVTTQPPSANSFLISPSALVTRVSNTTNMPYDIAEKAVLEMANWIDYHGLHIFAYNMRKELRK